MPIRAALLVFDGCDAMDVVGPYEVFLTANRLRVRAGREPVFDVVVVGDAEVTAYGGLRLVPASSPTETGPVDVLVVPGAIDVEAARPDDAIQALAGTSEVLASVCTGVFFLHRLGLVGERQVTTHWEDVPLLREAGADARDDVRWVDGGTLVTSGGISSGVAMALHLVERYADRELAEATARQIDYVWTESR